MTYLCSTLVWSEDPCRGIPVLLPTPVKHFGRCLRLFEHQYLARVVEVIQP